MKKILLILTVIGLLQGCVAVVGGAAVGAAGATAIYNKQNIQATLADNNMQDAIVKNLEANTDIVNQSHIVVAVYRSVVLLAGQAPTTGLKALAENIASKTPKIKRLYNEITIEGPSSTLTRTSDTWVTTKIKTQFLATDHLKSGQFKVVTENGTVFLMGIVTRDQAQLAVNVAREINGVQKVVKMFEYKRDPGEAPINTTPDQQNTTSSNADAGTV